MDKGKNTYFSHYIQLKHLKVESAKKMKNFIKNLLTKGFVSGILYMQISNRAKRVLKS